jgi:hypothetical protein
MNDNAYFPDRAKLVWNLFPRFSGHAERFSLGPAGFPKIASACAPPAGTLTLWPGIVLG